MCLVLFGRFLLRKVPSFFLLFFGFGDFGDFGDFVLCFISKFLVSC